MTAFKVQQLKFLNKIELSLLKNERRHGELQNLKISMQ